jgi:hypothetical protein
MSRSGATTADNKLSDKGVADVGDRATARGGKTAREQVDDALVAVVTLTKAQKAEAKARAGREGHPAIDVEKTMREETRRRNVRRVRAAASVDAWEAAGRPRMVRTRRGAVSIASMRVIEDRGEPFVEVWLGGTVDGECHFRVFNPPVMVEDPAGDVVVAASGSRPEVRLLEDPLRAVAEAVAEATAGSKRGGRR